MRGTSNAKAWPVGWVRRAVVIPALMCIGACFLPAGAAFALDKSTGREGARIDILKLAATFGLDGVGVRIGQSEPTEPLTSHEAFDGNVTRRGVGAVDDHATGVASILVGAWIIPPPPFGLPDLVGAANGANLWSAGGDYYARLLWLAGNNVHIINNSAGFGLNPDGKSAQTLFADWLVQDRNVLFTQAIGNRPEFPTVAVPGDAYNVITVGAVGANNAGNTSDDYRRVANYSTRGPTQEQLPSPLRHKPDIVAPGSLIDMAGGDSDDDLYQRSGTSFAAPHVAGVAALLRERAATYAAPPGNYDWRFDRRVLKATILNAASKHVTDPGNANRAWPRSSAATASGIPLDNAMGVGALNGLATIRQYNPADSQIGVRSAEIGANATVESAGGGFLTRGSLVTATLTWERDVLLDILAEDLNDPASYIATNLANLDLRLVRSDGDAVVAESISSVDNVEHIYFNVPQDGFYRLRVVNRSADTPRYGLAYSAGSASGPAFSVRDEGDHRAEGLILFNHPYPNDVNALGVAGPANFRTGGEVFVGSGGANQQRLSGALGTLSRVGPHNGPPASMSVLEDAKRGAFGLQNLDEITGLSWGTDGSRRRDGAEIKPTDSSIIFFSVDPDATGREGTGVRRESSLTAPLPMNNLNPPFPKNPGGGDPGPFDGGGGNEAAGDIFKTMELPKFGWYGSPLETPATALNVLAIDESAFGLQAPAGRGSLLADGREDDLDAFEFDDPVFHPRHPVDRDGDGMHNEPVFFTLSKDSPTITGTAGFDPSDIFVSMPRDPSAGFNDFQDDPIGGMFHIDVWADHTMLGLQANDIIDALIVSDVGLGGKPNGMTGGLGMQPDEVLFSLAPGSPSLGDGSPLNAGAGDILYSALNSNWSIFAAAGAIGLLANDNLNALDIKRYSQFPIIPCPSTICLAGVASLVLLTTGSRRRQCQRR